MFLTMVLTIISVDEEDKSGGDRAMVDHVSERAVHEFDIRRKVGGHLGKCQQRARGGLAPSTSPQNSKSGPWSPSPGES